MIDPNPNLSGANYYRLRIVDENGQFSYSETVEIRFGSGVGLTSLFPNPVENGGSLQVSYYAESEIPLRLQLFDLRGKELFRNEHVVTEGANQFQVDLPELPEGVYLARFHGGNLVQTTKIMIRK